MAISLMKTLRNCKVLHIPLRSFAKNRIASLSPRSHTSRKRFSFDPRKFAMVCNGVSSKQSIAETTSPSAERYGRRSRARSRTVPSRTTELLRLNRRQFPPQASSTPRISILKRRRKISSAIAVHCPNGSIQTMSPIQKRPNVSFSERNSLGRYDYDMQINSVQIQSDQVVHRNCKVVIENVLNAKVLLDKFCDDPKLNGHLEAVVLLDRLKIHNGNWLDQRTHVVKPWPPDLFNENRHERKLRKDIYIEENAADFSKNEPLDNECLTLRKRTIKYNQDTLITRTRRLALGVFRRSDRQTHTQERQFSQRHQRQKLITSNAFIRSYSLLDNGSHSIVDNINSNRSRQCTSTTRRKRNLPRRTSDGKKPADRPLRLSRSNLKRMLPGRQTDVDVPHKRARFEARNTQVDQTGDPARVRSFNSIRPIYAQPLPASAKPSPKCHKTAFVNLGGRGQVISLANLSKKVRPKYGRRPSEAAESPLKTGRTTRIPTKFRLPSIPQEDVKYWILYKLKHVTVSLPRLPL